MGGPGYQSPAPSAEEVKNEEQQEQTPVEVKEDAAAPADVPTAEAQEAASEETQETVAEATAE